MRREEEIVEALGVSSSTVYRVKRDFVEYGLDAALSEGSRPGRPRKTGAHEDALLVSIACSTPPAGRCRWTLVVVGGALGGIDGPGGGIPGEHTATVEGESAQALAAEDVVFGADGCGVYCPDGAYSGCVC